MFHLPIYNVSTLQQTRHLWMFKYLCWVKVINMCGLKASEDREPKHSKLVLWELTLLMTPIIDVYTNMPMTMLDVPSYKITLAWKLPSPQVSLIDAAWKRVPAFSPYPSILSSRHSCYTYNHITITALCVSHNGQIICYVDRDRNFVTPLLFVELVPCPCIWPISLKTLLTYIPV